MTPLFRAALDLQRFFEWQRWRFCIIGGIALLRWGEPRYTRDVDVTGVPIDIAQGGLLLNLSLSSAHRLLTSEPTVPSRPAPLRI